MNINYGKSILFSAFFLFTFVGYSQNQTFEQLYSKECKKAFDFYKQHKSKFETAAEKIGLPPQMIFAIVAPEITQYSYLKNKIETYSLKVLYVQYGLAYSDFSVGFFQIKPSFVELLEKFATEDICFQKDFITINGKNKIIIYKGDNIYHYKIENL